MRYVGCEYYLQVTRIIHHQDEQGFKVALNLIGLNIAVNTANGMVMDDLSEFVYRPSAVASKSG